jgi:dolichol-phosphate mannosyltransferase
MNDFTAAAAEVMPPPGSGPLVELSITIAAYREAENLASMLPAIKAAAQALTPHHEILIVDTQEPMDDTAAICATNGVRHVRRVGGNSYGDAVRTLIGEARGEFILNMDADGSHSPSYLSSIWAQRDRYDITIGSRYAPGGHTDNPLILIWMSYVVNLTFRVVFSINAKDVTNSFRLYRKQILTSMHLDSNDFDILEEILIKASFQKPPARIGEVPVTFERRKAGESKRKLVQFAFGYLKTLKRLRSYSDAAKRQETTAKEVAR